MTGVQNTGFSPDWEEIILDAAKARKAAMRAVREEFGSDKKLLRMVQKGRSSDDAEARKAARALRSLGIPVETFTWFDTTMARNNLQTELVFGKLACGLLSFLKPYEHSREKKEYDWSKGFTPNEKRYTGYYNTTVASRAAWLAGYMVAILAELARYTTHSRTPSWASKEDLEKRWKEFEGLVGAKKNELLASRVVASALRASDDVLESLKKRGPSLSRWPRAAALLQAAGFVRDELERSKANDRPLAREDMRRALDLLIWMKGLEEEARGDIEELGLLELIGERPSWSGENTAWKLLAADLRSARGIQLHIWMRWIRRAVQRTARKRATPAGTRPAA